MRRASLAGAISITILALLLPLVLTQPYLQHMLVASVINCILAVSLGIVIGFLGELSLAHGAFYGIGAYTSALLAKNFGVPFFLALPAGTLGAALAGFLIGIPALRLSGHYFAIATLGFQGIVILLITNLVEITRGPMGLSGIPPPGGIQLFGGGISFQTKTGFYYLSLAVLLITLWFTYNLMRSKFGQGFIAIREDPLLAASVGIRTKRYRLLAFCVSAAFAGAAGSLYAHYTLFISPDSFSLGESVYIATMVIIGGMGTIPGPLVGAALLTTLPEMLRVAGGLQFVLYGLIAMIVVIFMPKGIVGMATMYLRGQRDARIPAPGVTPGG
ncbi:branched-chain amino acid ABC transporter permease [Candidatus Deferrimicrobium sp.]|uniref:branched-chain amino acid ABC transporter permease n=1 Tax=Candidatus Deferrimicrobium sp. TaxID=3060586 RepID=UPI003C526FCF